jgi:hypothetical protein
VRCNIKSHETQTAIHVENSWKCVQRLERLSLGHQLSAIFSSTDLAIALLASIPEPQREAWTRNQVKGFKSKDEFEKEVVRHVETTLARSIFNCDETAAYSAASLAFRDRLILDWNKTQQRQTFADAKRVYYFSLEFLMGRTLDNAMLNLGLKKEAQGKQLVPRPSQDIYAIFACYGVVLAVLRM